jgi:signal transduction histidine kinase/CHASE3 domain sensor protein
MRFGLASRVFLGGVIVLALLVARFVTTQHSLDAVRHATSDEERAGQSASTAQTLENLVLKLEIGARGFIITRDATLLQPWTQARAALPGVSKQLLEEDASPAALQIDAAWRDYLGTWSEPLVALARTDPAAARNRLTQSRANTQINGVRSQIDSYVATRLVAVAGYKKRVAYVEHQAFVISVVGIVLTVLLLVIVVGYLLAAVIEPVRHIADATGAIAKGHPNVLVPEKGSGEVGQLAAAFNAMSLSLAQQRRSLAAQNIDLERLANVLRAVLDSTVDGILLTDHAGNVQLANRPLTEMTRDMGMTFDGTVTERLVSVAERMKNPAEFRQAMLELQGDPDSASFNEFEDVVSGRVYQGWTAPVRDDGGTFVGRIWTLRDVSSQRELDRLKDDFVATVSHELRTPLTSMMGFLQMIRDGEAGELNPEQERFLSIVYRSSERLQRLVGDLLFVSRLDSSGLQLHVQPVHVDEVLREAVETVDGIVRSHNLTLTTELGPVPPVDGDRERLSQLFANLLSNAVKFTPAGGQIVARTYSSNGIVVAEVEDTGIGIPENEQDRLFQRFFRSSTASAQAIPGTGLGLVISKAIAEAHGGTIHVRSAPETGTCFSVAIPIEPAGA